MSKYIVKSSAGKFQTVNKERAYRRVDELRAAGMSARLLTIPASR